MTAMMPRVPALLTGPRSGRPGSHKSPAGCCSRRAGRCYCCTSDRHAPSPGGTVMTVTVLQRELGHVYLNLQRELFGKATGAAGRRGKSAGCRARCTPSWRTPPAGWSSGWCWVTRWMTIQRNKGPDPVYTLFCLSFKVSLCHLLRAEPLGSSCCPSVAVWKSRYQNTGRGLGSCANLLCLSVSRVAAGIC